MTLSERLTQVGEILVALSSTPIPSQQFQTLADYVNLVIPCDFLAICLQDLDIQGYLVHVLVGDFVSPRLFSPDEGIPGQVIQSNRSILVDDLLAHPAKTADLEGLCIQQGLQTALVTPLRQEKKAIGALFFAAYAPTRYNTEDAQIGNLLAAGLSAVLENSRLYQALADERSTMAAVLRSVGDAVLMVNEQNIVLLVNPAAGKMLQLDPITAVGQPLPSITPNLAILELFAQCKPDVTEVQLPHGSIAQASLVPVVSDYGEAIGWAAIFRDITLFKQLEQMKNDFVNTVSHDLKNPISTILLSANLMDKVGTLNERQLDLQGRVTETANYMNELVSDLLDLGKIEAGFDMEIALFDVVQVVQSVLLAIQPNIERKNHQLFADLSPELLILGNKNRIRQVLTNIIGNAVKYTPEGGTIWVTVEAEPTQAVIQVQDDGIGIPATDLPYIFDKFYRVRNENTKNIKGTGLGLAITKSIVEANNGRIWAESIPGKGTTFTVTFPLA